MKMNLLVILLLLPMAISVQRYRSSNPNNEPFLPIFPIYPYSPKLIKRGTEKHFISQLNPNVFATKPNVRDSYSSSFNGNYQRDPTSATSTPNIYQSAYTSTNQAYSPSKTYATLPRINPTNYNANLYPYALYNGYPVALIPQQTDSLPNQQVYYSNYKQPYYNSNEMSKNIRPEKNSDSQKSELSTFKDGFIDGANYISNSRDEDANSYKTFNHLQVPDASEVYLRTAQLPSPPYQFVGIEGQQNRQPNYALSPSGYKYHQLDSTMAAALSRLLAQQSVAQRGLVSQTENQYEVSDFNQNMAPPAVRPNPSSVIAKTGLAYVMNQPINVAPRHIPKMSETFQLLDADAIEKGQKMTQVTFEPSESIYIPPMKALKNQSRHPTNYNEYMQSTPLYGAGSVSEAQNIHHTIQQHPQAYTYRYTGYNSTPVNQEQFTNYRLPLEDINYASKRNV